jgi:RND family efflux transporter MFP subunit
LFGGFGDGRNIDFQIQSSDFAALLPVARRAQELIKEKMPGAQIQAGQGFDLAQPELRLQPDDRRISEVGWSRGDVGTVVRALGDGAWVGEYFDGERRLDMILRAREWGSPEELSSVLVSTPSGAAIPLGELVGVDATVGPTALRRVDGRRTVGLNVSPPKGLSLQQAIDVLKADVEPEVRKLLPADGSVRYAGNAGNLKAALSNMRENLTLAFLVLFLVMAALFRSAKDSLYVMLTIPLASFGGVLGLWVLRLFTFQTLDLLTMVGFVVLMGLVVNNAILLTDETRAGERAGLPRREAIAAALRTRTRPIVTITLTTLLGMLPMVVVPGPGSALYRGLGAVICGGMALNAVFTLVLLPALLRLTEREASAREDAMAHKARINPTTVNPATAAVLLLGLLPAWQYARAADKPAAPVVVAQARQQSFAASVTATGTVASRNDARLSSDVSGTLEWIAEPGRAVSAGDVVARLNEERLKLAVRDNEAAVKRLEANLQLLAAQSERLQSLATQNVVSRNQLDEAVSRRAMAEQELEQARVARDRAMLDLRHATVRAPFAGFVAERLQQSGEYVAAGVVLARLVDTRHVEVIARAPVSTAGSIRVGQPVRISDDGRTVESRVHSVIPIGDERSRLLEVRVALDGNEWPIGSPVRVQLAGANAQRAVTVPRDAVIQRQGAAYVFRIDAKSNAQRIPVRVGAGRESEVEIVGEVVAGDRIVIRGGERLQPGQAVKIQSSTT